jgi:hypothetical protein
MTSLPPQQDPPEALFPGDMLRNRFIKCHESPVSDAANVGRRWPTGDTQHQTLHENLVERPPPLVGRSS